MTYKDLNVYQRAYKVALDLHRFIESESTKIIPNFSERLQTLSRDVLGNIAEAFAQRTARAKRFFNFKARDLVHTIQMDLDFLHDIHSLPDQEYTDFYREYEVCSKQLFKLNQSILNNVGKESKKEQVAVAA